jgi:hypothetical protein
MTIEQCAWMTILAIIGVTCGWVAVAVMFAWAETWGKKEDTVEERRRKLMGGGR